MISPQFGGRQKTGKGGKGGMIMSRDRGRYLRPVLPKQGETIRVAIGMYWCYLRVCVNMYSGDCV